MFHIGFFRTTLAVLQCVCKSCSRVLITGKARKRHLAYMRDPRIDAVRKAKNFKAIVDVRPSRTRALCVRVCVHALHGCVHARVFEFGWLCVIEWLFFTRSGIWY